MCVCVCVCVRVRMREYVCVSCESDVSTAVCLSVRKCKYNNLCNT